MLEARTYTNIWNQDKKLYSIYEWQLPTPVSFRQLGLFFLGALIWCPIAWIIGIPVTSSIGFILWFGPPIALAIFGNKPIYEDKTLFQWISGLLGYATEPKRIMDGRPVDKAEFMAGDHDEDNVEQHHFEISVWRRVRKDHE